jgi:hypothetical protein
MLSAPPQSEYTFGMSWQVITPLLLLGTGSVAMIIWYFSSNEFLDAGFPPRAAEAFRIASVAADEWQLRHSIRYWRLGIEIALANGISPFDDRILRIKGRLMETIRKEGDIGMEREVLQEIKEQAIREVQAGNKKDRGKLVSLAVQASMAIANVSSQEKNWLTVDKSRRYSGGYERAREGAFLGCKDFTAGESTTTVDTELFNRALGMDTRTTRSAKSS